MVVRSGLADLGKWVRDERDLYEDYKTHIGGSARSVVNIWLLGVSSSSAAAARVGLPISRFPSQAPHR